MRKRVFSAICSLVMTGFILFTHGTAAAEDMFKITLIDVGKGDCILVQTGAEDAPVTVMIDTGYKETANIVLEYLRAHNIQKLDAMIISHFHKDHVGGAAAILKEIPVSRVYMPDYEGTKKVYDEMMEVLKESGGAIPYQRLSENLSFSLGDAEYWLIPAASPSTKTTITTSLWPYAWNTAAILPCLPATWKRTASNNSFPIIRSPKSITTS